MMDDPYKYFKRPPFQDITVLNQAESPVDANGGVLYVQNAAPDGPAAFMFTEIVSRPYRWADDQWKTAGRQRAQCSEWPDKAVHPLLTVSIYVSHLLYSINVMRCSPVT